MGYLTNSGTGFLSSTVNAVSSVKSYLVSKGGYLFDTIRVGIGDYGQRVLDDSGIVEAALAASQAYREITKAIFDSASLVLFPSGYKESKVYSHKPTSGAADLTYSRATGNATRINSSGYIEKRRENLYTQSNNFTSSDWNDKSGNFSQTVTDPNGGTEAWAWKAVDTDPHLLQNKTLSGAHCVSIWVKGFGSTVGADFQINVGSDTANFTLTSDWQRLEHFGVLSGTSGIGFEYGNPATIGDIVHIYAAQLQLGSVATDVIISGSTTGTSGLLEDTPRIDFTDGTSLPSILLEPQRTNLMTQSEFASLASVSNVSRTPNYILSPEGLKNATRLQFTSNGSLANNTLSSGTQYSLSCYAKRNDSGTQNVGFFVDGTGTVDSAWSLTSDWQRLTYTYTASNSDYVGIAGLSGADISVYGFQIEASDSVTSYIPTYGASATRAADTFSALTYDDNFNSLTFYADLEMKDVIRESATPTIRFGHTTSNLGSIRIFRSSASNAKRAVVNVRNLSSSNIINNITASADRAKIKITYNSSSGAWELFINDSSVATGTSTDFNEFDTLEISGAGGSAKLYKLYIKNSI